MSQLGCHGQINTPEQLQYAAVSYVAKSTDDLAVIEAAPTGALQIARRIFNVQEQDNFIDTQDYVGCSNAILDFLHGYRNENLYVEVLNEIGKGRNAAYVQLCKKVVPRLQTAGVKVLVPSWGTGDWEWNEWLAWRNENWCGADGIGLHAYWGLPKGTPPVYKQLFSEWNALRYRSYWNIGGSDPKLLVVTECGRDRVNDGPNNSSVGNGGYIADGLSAEEFSVELLAYNGCLLQDKVIGTPFTNGPKPDMANFNMDPVVQYLLPHAGPCILPDLNNGGGQPVNPGELEAYAADMWKRYGIPLNPNSALYNYWFTALKAGNFLGFPMEQEHPWTQSNNKYMVQGFSSTILTYTIATGKVTEGLPPL